jgi:protoheme IX farnesyltransferase
MNYPLMNRILKTVDIMPRHASFKQQERAIIHKSNHGQLFHSYLELFKIRIALFAALSAATGSILVNSAVSAGTFISTAGVFLLACGAGTLNQFQERKIDTMMLRTQSRPIPSGRIKSVSALYAALLLFITGFLILSLSGNLTVYGLGIFAVLWYNLVYTFLKKITAFSAVPGAITGAIPPAIGWVTGGGGLSDIRLTAICFFFFMWQVPHFWLLLLSHAEDFRKARTPSLNKVFRWEQLIKITAVWMSAVAVSSLFIPFYGVAVSDTVTIMLASGAGWLAWSSVLLYTQKARKSVCSDTFRSINIYIVVVMLLLNVGSVFSL